MTAICTIRAVEAGDRVRLAWVGHPSRARALRDGLVVAGLLFAAYLFFVEAPRTQTVGFDAFSYWSVNLSQPYGQVVGSLDFFPYTPVAARLFAPASLLSWPQFWFVWSLVLVGTLAWLGWRSTLVLLAFPPVAIELYHGNIDLLIAAAIALGFRYPAAWAFPLLTKASPGIGIVWFLVRREWRSLGIALGTTGVILAASLALDGRLWVDWLRDNVLAGLTTPVASPSIPIPMWLRLPVALGLVAWGARTDRRWTVPVGATLALPVLWYSGAAILAALPALDRPQLRERPDAVPTRVAASAVACS